MEEGNEGGSEERRKRRRGGREGGRKGGKGGGGEEAREGRREGGNEGRGEGRREGERDIVKLHFANVLSAPGCAPKNEELPCTHHLGQRLTTMRRFPFTRVRSNYVEDSASHVPVQAVVRAFKEAFNYDITYKVGTMLV